MFPSKIRDVIIPQYEHERLAGSLARMWGNEQFARPELPFDSFVAGVALHDWHYGFADTHPIGGGNEAEWIQLVTRGVEYRFDDPVTDIVVKLHIKRLLGGQETAERGELIRRVEEHIRERLPESGFGRAAFERADKITRLCDRLALEFSFEAPADGAVEVFAAPGQDTETRIRYRVEGGKIWLEPWPFAADASGGVILAYRREGYPETLTPVIVPFALSRQAF